jgi:hypothetical protein
MDTPLLRYGWPLLAGNLLLLLLSFLSNGALPYLLVILLLTPLAMAAVQGKGALPSATVALLAGSLLGALLGYLLTSAPPRAMAAAVEASGPALADELLLWWATGASFCASLGAFIAGELWRSRNAK